VFAIHAGGVRAVQSLARQRSIVSRKGRNRPSMVRHLRADVFHHLSTTGGVRPATAAASVCVGREYGS
jgi:hypothetical protein